MPKYVIIPGYFGPFFSAIRENDRKTIDKYIEIGIDLNKEREKLDGYLGENALEKAVVHGQIDLVKYFITLGSKITNVAFEEAVLNHIEIAEYFLKIGYKPDLNVQSVVFNRTLLMKAVLCDNEKAVTFLLKNGADYTLKDNSKHTALDVAISSKMYNAIRGFGKCINIFPERTQKRIRKHRIRAIVNTK